MKRRIVGVCGIICSDCRAFIATQKNDRELKKEVAKSWSTEQESVTPEDINCEGCFASGERLLKFSEACAVRCCGRARKVENCAHCDEFPCVKLSDFWKSMGTTEQRTTLEEIRKGLPAQ